MRHYHIYIDRKGEGRWRRVSGGNIVSTCHEGYKGGTRSAALASARRGAIKDAGTMPYKIKVVEA